MVKNENKNKMWNLYLLAFKSFWQWYKQRYEINFYKRRITSTCCSYCGLFCKPRILSFCSIDCRDRADYCPMPFNESKMKLFEMITNMFPKKINDEIYKLAIIKYQFGGDPPNILISPEYVQDWKRKKESENKELNDAIALSLKSYHASIMKREEEMIDAWQLSIQKNYNDSLLSLRIT